MRHPFTYLRKWKERYPLVWTWIAPFGNTLLGIYDLLWRSGYLRSCLVRKSVDYKGRPLPWIAPAATDFLAKLDVTNVLEYGGGQSSLWFKGLGWNVTVVEADNFWATILESKGLEVLRDIRYAGNRPFNLLVIDANPRKPALDWLKDTKHKPLYVLVDNTNSEDVETGIGELNKGLSDLYPNRVDFIGHAPGAIAKQATSLYFHTLPSTRSLPYKIHNSFWTF